MTPITLRQKNVLLRVERDLEQDVAGRVRVPYWGTKEQKQRALGKLKAIIASGDFNQASAVIASTFRDGNHKGVIETLTKGV